MLPIHCAVLQGRKDAVEFFLNIDAADGIISNLLAAERKDMVNNNNNNNNNITNSNHHNNNDNNVASSSQYRYHNQPNKQGQIGR